MVVALVALMALVVLMALEALETLLMAGKTTRERAQRRIAKREPTYRPRPRHTSKVTSLASTMAMTWASQNPAREEIVWDQS